MFEWKRSCIDGRYLNAFKNSPPATQRREPSRRLERGCPEELGLFSVQINSADQLQIRSPIPRALSREVLAYLKDPVANELPSPTHYLSHENNLMMKMSNGGSKWSSFNFNIQQEENWQIGAQGKRLYMEHHSDKPCDKWWHQSTLKFPQSL